MPGIILLNLVVIAVLVCWYMFKRAVPGMRGAIIIHADIVTQHHFIVEVAAIVLNHLVSLVVL